MSRSRFSLLDMALLAATAVWTAVMVAQFLDVLTVASSSRTTDLLLVMPPLALAGIWVLGGHEPSPAIPVATAMTVAVAAILLLTPQVIAQPTLAYGIPGVIVLSWLVYRRPTIGAVPVLLVTASFGSLYLYLSFPYKRAITVVFLALWIAMIVRFAVGRRTGVLQLPFGVVIAIAYVVISAMQIVLASDRHLALAGFELAPLYMTVMFVAAYSQWPADSMRRIVGWFVVLAILVGGYATLRLLIGPSAQERMLASATVFNFVNGRQKDIGSFMSGPDLAEWTSLAIPFLLSCALGLRGRLRALALAAIPLLAVGLFASRMRAPALAAGIGVLVVALLHARPRAFRFTRVAHTAVAIMATVAVGTGAFIAGGGNAEGHSYLALLTANTHDTSLAAHEYDWKVAFHDLAGHPFGYGLGTAPAGYVSNVSATAKILPVTDFSVDNGYLKIALEQGVTVMVVFALTLVLLVGALARGGLTVSDPTRATIALGAAGTAVCFVVLEGASPYVDGVPAIAGWLIIGLGLAQFVWRRTAVE